ncbi:MAG: hypothetical protein ACYTFI_25920 [Planctomycetota bacterium]|jgi:hypothetical protein
MSSDTGGPAGGTGFAKILSHPAAGIVLGIVGALVGGAVGHFLFLAMTRWDLYAMVLPGAAVGLGCGLLSGRRSVPLGIASAVIGLVVSVFTEWRCFPRPADSSLSFFLKHLHELGGRSLMMILLGAAFAFWFGLGRTGGIWFRRRRGPDSAPGSEGGA